HINRILLKPIFTAIGLLLGISAMAQEPLQYSFTHYGTSTGLMTNQVNTIAQDRQGFIWVGTTDGLQRYDGIRFKSFQHHENDSASLPSEPVWQLLVDKKNNLWVLLASGRVGIFDVQTARFHEVPAIFRNTVSPNTFLKKLITDESGNVFYLISGSELITWEEKNHSFSYRNNFVPFKDNW